MHAATQHFKLPADPRRLAIEIADGHDYVAATERRVRPDRSSTATTPSAAWECSTRSRSTAGCRARLTDEGVLVTNFLNRRRGLAEGLERMDARSTTGPAHCPPARPAMSSCLAAAGTPVEVPLAELRVRRARVEARHRAQPAADRGAGREAAGRHFGPLRALTAAAIEYVRPVEPHWAAAATSRKFRPAARRRRGRAGRAAVRRAGRGRETTGKLPRGATFRRTNRCSA